MWGVAMLRLISPYTSTFMGPEALRKSLNRKLIEGEASFRGCSADMTDLEDYGEVRGSGKACFT